MRLTHNLCKCVNAIKAHQQLEQVSIRWTTWLIYTVLKIARVRQWIVNYLRRSQATVLFHNASSRTRNVCWGVVQGGVLSPALFNLYMANLPAPPPSIKIMSYADNVIIYATGQNIDVLVEDLNEYLKHVSAFFQGKNLQVSASQSSVTLFTASPGQIPPLGEAKWSSTSPEHQPEDPWCNGQQILLRPT